MAENSKMHRYAQRSAKLLGIAVGEYTARRNAGEKWCGRCKSWKLLPDFGGDSHAWDGLYTACLACTHVKVRKPNLSSRMKGKRHSEETRARMRASKRGAKNSNWKGGVTPAIRRARQHALYQQWRRAVLSRDEHRCRDCGACGPGLHAHHVVSFKTHPHLRLEVTNGRTLCPPCHRRAHKCHDGGKEIAWAA